MKKNILLIGVGGTGSNAVDTFFKKAHELGVQNDNKVTALVFDTDAGDLKKITTAKTVVMSDTASVGTICDRIGKQYLQEWFPCDAKDVRAQEMVRGASQWRKKSYLAFLNLMNKPAARSTFISALEDMIQDPGASCEVYVIASVAGGTGSGSFIPIALYAKRYLRKNLGKDPIVNAMIALPDIYADSQTPENRIKVYSNAYAILRELNAINLVARNYNAALTAKKKAPIRFRIGHPDEPNVGVLFDASDKRFWTPQAAPFSQIFLLDRIPGLNSISAHDMVLANSLYSILCTDIGAAFDSEFSNHELVRSQNNGSNAIYAGISTSQIRFPRETVLDYLSYKKTLTSCDGEWLTLHNSVENDIREKEREAKAAKRRFVMKDGEYARILLAALETKQNDNCDDLIAIVERGVDLMDEEGKRRDKNAGDLFMAEIKNYINERVGNTDDAAARMNNVFPSQKKGAKKLEKKKIASAAKEASNELFEYYKECLDTVRTAPVTIADSVLTLDKKKIGTIGDKYSIVKHLLMAGENYVHPVAALIRLCQFRVLLAEELKKKASEWQELKKRSITELPDRYTKGLDPAVTGKSAYNALGEDRFNMMISETSMPAAYADAKTSTADDLASLKQDAGTVLSKIHSDTKRQVSYKVFTRIAEDVDLLIAKYRSFFNRFEKEKESLEEQTKDAYRKDEAPIDSLINVYCSKANKDAVLAEIEEGNGPVTDADIAATDNIVGKGVCNTAMSAAVAERSADGSFNEKDSGAYRSLFSSMVDAYRTSIGKSEIFANIASYNVIEAIVKSCGEGAGKKEIDDALRSAFSVAQELAIPSLRLEPSKPETDLVEPSHIMVFMMSRNTARYIKRNAETFGLHLPADQSNENSVMRACAESFIRDFSGNNAARVAIVNSIPDQMLYCTGEIMDITPLRIAKFNELGEDSVYFKNYNEAIDRYKKYETDMWNPHLGDDLYKRGHLPYMNAEMENACDEKMVKALLRALQRGYIYAEPSRNRRCCYCYDGVKITDSQGNLINSKNIAQLLEWMRDHEAEIDRWSAEFDSEIQRQINALPSVISESERETLKDHLTRSPFIRMLNQNLFKDPEENGVKVGVNSEGRGNTIGEEKSGLRWVNKEGPTAVEFAYLIRTSEEAGRDCDDAERILRVLYKIFLELISSRVNPETAPEHFIDVYKHQLRKFYEAFASIEVIADTEKECETHYSQLVSWLNRTGLFLDIPDDTPLDSKGKVQINANFRYESTPSIKAILNFIKKGKPTGAAKAGLASASEDIPTDSEI